MLNSGQCDRKESRVWEIGIAAGGTGAGSNINYDVRLGRVRG